MIDPRADISPAAHIDPDCRVGLGAVVCRGVTVERDVTIGPYVVFVEPTGGEADSHVEAGVTIGAHATIYAGVRLAAKSVVRAGAVVTRSVPPGAIVEGHPATITGYVDTEPGFRSPALLQSSRNAVEATPVQGVTLHHFPVIPDLRGNLTVGEFERQIPFRPLRYFMVFGVPSKEIRGEHAHRVCHQFLICVRGSCAVVADDGKKRVELLLDAPHKGVYLPPQTWGIQYKYSEDAILLVFASHHYDAKDYIRNYNDFIELVGQ